MKQFLLALFLLVTTAPLFANDEGGDGFYVSNSREMLHQGGEAMSISPIRSAPKPTQAYYGNGYVVYYGYSAVPVRTYDTNMVYAFGYPVDYFRQMMPVSTVETNLNRYAVQTRVQSSVYGPGDFVARAREAHSRAMTTVQATRARQTTQTAQTTQATQTTKSTSTASNGATNPLPAIGEKPSH